MENTYFANLASSGIHYYENPRGGIIGISCQDDGLWHVHAYAPGMLVSLSEVDHLLNLGKFSNYCCDCISALGLEDADRVIDSALNGRLTPIAHDRIPAWAQRQIQSCGGNSVIRTRSLFRPVIQEFVS